MKLFVITGEGCADCFFKCMSKEYALRNFNAGLDESIKCGKIEVREIETLSDFLALCPDEFNIGNEGACP